jgi:hypothetical protein
MCLRAGGRRSVVNWSWSPTQAFPRRQFNAVLTFEQARLMRIFSRIINHLVRRRGAGLAYFIGE